MEFEQDCQDTLRGFAGGYIARHNTWIGTNDLIELIALNLPKKGYIPFDETFENISFGMGGSEILRPDDCNGDSEDAIRKLLGGELLKKAYAKNKLIEDRI